MLKPKSLIVNGFTNKIKADGIFIAKLVAKGLRQTHSIDYDETFSPVFMLKSIRILFVIVAYYNYEI